MCVGVRVRRSKTRQSHTVRRSKTGLSHRVSLEVLCGVCRGQGSQIQDPAVTHGSQIQDRAVTQGVVGGVVCVGVRVRRSKTGQSHRVSLEVSSGGLGVRVRRFKTGLSQCGFADPGPGCHTGCRWRCNLLMCVGVRGLQI